MDFKLYAVQDHQLHVPKFGQSEQVVRNFYEFVPFCRKL